MDGSDQARALRQLAELHAAGALTPAELAVAQAEVRGAEALGEAGPSSHGPDSPWPDPSVSAPRPVHAQRPARPPVRWRLPAAAVAVTLVVLAGTLVATGGLDRLFGRGEVFLEAAAGQGSDPFTADAARQLPATPLPVDEVAPTGGAGIPSIRGGEPGLYGGDPNNPSCNRQQIIDFLAGEQAKAAAWAGVQGITADAIPAFVNGLTSTVLLRDTRVTNHGFADGRATPRQSVLQAGTAVLVDDRGVPRARCACGNPLAAAEPTGVTPAFSGAPWAGFDDERLGVVVPHDTRLDVLTLVDLRTGERFDRPVGSDGEADASTGQVQVQLTWRGTADLDLYVTEPGGARTSYEATTSPTGGTLDVDANAGCTGSVSSDQVNIENIFWPGGQAPSGTYNASVSLWGECGGSTPTYRLRITVGARVVHDQVRPFDYGATGITFTNDG